MLGLAKAGVSEHELASAVREAFDVNRELLQAVKIELKAVGEEVHRVESSDNAARQRAVNALYALGGLQNAPVQDTGPKGPMFTLVLPNYYQPELLAQPTIDVEVGEQPIPSPWEG